jgi:hypothetical protein
MILLTKLTLSITINEEELEKEREQYGQDGR